MKVKFIHYRANSARYNRSYVSCLSMILLVTSCASLYMMVKLVQDVTLNEYNPSNSNTSETISCGSSSCLVQSSCSGSNSNCTYSISYVSDNTSSSGYLVEDVLYLTTETNKTETIQASIIFGYVQTNNSSLMLGAKKVEILVL